MRVPSLPTVSWTTLNVEAVRPCSTSVGVCTHKFSRRPVAESRKGQSLPWPHELYVENKWVQNKQLQTCCRTETWCNNHDVIRTKQHVTYDDRHLCLSCQIVPPYLRPTINSGLETIQEVGRNMTSTPAYKTQILKRFWFCNCRC